MSDTPSVLTTAIQSQRFKVVLQGLLVSSGFLGLDIVKRLFPGVDPGEVSQQIIIAIPLIINFLIEWYRNHPDNILRRAVKVINGGTAAPAVVATVAAHATAATNEKPDAPS